MATSRTNLQPASTCCNPRVLRESSDLLLYKLKNGMARLLKHDASSRVEIRWQADAFVKKVIEYWASNVSARKGTIQLIKIDQGYTAQMSPLARCETREAMTMIQWNYAGEDQIFAKSCDCKMWCPTESNVRMAIHCNTQHSLLVDSLVRLRKAAPGKMWANQIQSLGAPWNKTPPVTWQQLGNISECYSAIITVFATKTMAQAWSQATRPATMDK